MNCQLFVQQLLDVVKIKSLPRLKKNIILLKKGIKNVDILKVCDILEFRDISHYAVYIGNGDVLEVEQWGAKPRINTLDNLLNDYERTTSIYRKN